jgi:DNA-3-methyladenine glycosylase I
MKRCDWADGSVLEKEYHDEQWGVPVHDERLLFEFLLLEGAQAGLSWLTILKKRDGYKAAFDNFEADKIAKYTDRKISQLLLNRQIVRNKGKINAAVINARAYLDIQIRFGSFNNYIWGFVDGKTLQNRWKSPADIPVSTPLSESMSKDLKARGFKFVGPTICYAFMQAVGMVNDHVIDCFRYEPIRSLST